MSMVYSCLQTSSSGDAVLNEYTETIPLPVTTVTANARQVVFPSIIERSRDFAESIDALVASNILRDRNEFYEAVESALPFEKLPVRVILDSLNTVEMESPPSASESENMVMQITLDFDLCV